MSNRLEEIKCLEALQQNVTLQADWGMHPQFVQNTLSAIGENLVSIYEEIISEHTEGIEKCKHEFGVNLNQWTKEKIVKELEKRLKKVQKAYG